MKNIPGIGNARWPDGIILLASLKHAITRQKDVANVVCSCILMRLTRISRRYSSCHNNSNFFRRQHSLHHYTLRFRARAPIIRLRIN